MSDSMLSALTASTPGTAGLLYTVQGGADRKLAMTAAGASIIEAVNAAAQLSLLGAQPLATLLTTFGNLSNAAGVLANNGSGALSYVATTAGGNGETDAGKLPLLTANGGLSLGNTAVMDGTILTMRTGIGYGASIAVDMLGMGVYAELNGSASQAFHAHVGAGSTGGQTGFDADMTGGTGVNFAVSALVNPNGFQFYGREYTSGTGKDRLTISASGALTWYKDGTTISSGADKTTLSYATPAGTNTLTIPAETGTLALRGANTFTALQTITQGTTNAGVLSSTGYSLTGSNATSAFDIAGTLNTSGNPSVMRVAMTTTAAGTTTALARFLGTTTGAANIFAVLAPVADAQASAAIQIGAGLFCGEYTASASWWFGISNNKFASKFAINSSGVSVANNGYYAFGGDTFANSAEDLVIRRRAAAWLGLGTVSATPIEQTFSGCDGSGTNVTGGILNISAGRGTGTGISGVLNFRSHAAAASSSTVNASPVTVMQITNTTSITISDAVNFTLGTTTGTKWGVSTSAKQAWWGAAPVVQQVLATGGGATVDNVISLLQTLGLCKQS